MPRLSQSSPTLEGDGCRRWRWRGTPLGMLMVNAILVLSAALAAHTCRLALVRGHLAAPALSNAGALELRSRVASPKEFAAVPRRTLRRAEASGGRRRAAGISPKPKVVDDEDVVEDASTAARERFLTVLADKGGDWRDEAVQAELELLEKSNPTADPALTGAYLDADWLQVSRPDYNYGGTEGSTEYTLGQLSFNMYEPQDMKVQVEKTTQLVTPLDGDPDSRVWDISLHVTCADERYPPFKALLTTHGRIKPGKDQDGANRRLEVWFTSGELKPAPDTDPELRNQWATTFQSAQRERKRTIGSMLKGTMLKLMMGLSPPEGVQEDGAITWEMSRPPHGYTDILYIDDKLRVTRGNRGSIVAVTRSGA